MFMEKNIFFNYFQMVKHGNSIVNVNLTCELYCCSLQLNITGGLITKVNGKGKAFELMLNLRLE